jgi:hypothetical protein
MTKLLVSVWIIPSPDKLYSLYASYPKDNVGPFPELKRSGRETDQPSPYNILEIYRGWKK